ncbi:VWA domain-containing protein [Bacillus sp. 179-C3.3 HS]|uniref:VWA domain-containing protein n=1 Tax=Bacillus sp. 179-C3.3 HS TaxID=3232162 RepID=UPI0039A0D59E
MKRNIIFTILATLVLLLSSPAHAVTKKDPAHVVVLLDLSGSMAQSVEGEKKIAIAKRSIQSFASVLSEDTQIMLRVFGHEGTNKNAGKAISCASSEAVYGFGAYEQTTFQEALNVYKPTGWTPLAKALTDTKQDFEDHQAEGKNIVYVVSDGKETCGGSPSLAAKELHEEGIDTIVNIIGFDVNEKEEKSLKSVAKAGGGQYQPAANSEELNDILQKEASAFGQ